MRCKDATVTPISYEIWMTDRATAFQECLAKK